jgi:type VI secretion system protein ImpA
MTPEFTTASLHDSTAGFDIDVLVAPLPEPAGTGISLRYEPVYQQIREARHTDDPTLPMGDWERPLAKADWGAVASLCIDALSTRSKDFQLAAWLCEAWTHLYQIEGFRAGVALLDALAERYWDDAWPRIEEGDSDERCAPFVWINDALAAVLTLHVPLLRIEGREPAEINLYDWQRACTVVEGKGGQLSSEEMARHVRGANAERLVSMRRQLADALDEWTVLGHRLDGLLAHEAPSQGQVADALQRLSRAAVSLLGDYAPDGNAVDDAVPSDSADMQDMHDMQPLSIQHDAVAFTDRDAVNTAVPADGAGIVDRSHAYRLLRLIADYLERQEPHSPTPYLLRRAVSWGQMSLAELMQEIVQEEGDLNRYLALLDKSAR